MGIAKKDRNALRKQKNNREDVNLNRPDPYSRVKKEKEINTKNFGEAYIKTKEFKKKLFSDKREELLALTKIVDPKKVFNKKGANKDVKGGGR